MTLFLLHRPGTYPFILNQQTYTNLLPTVSPFDEKLAEDKSVNRLEDSYLLWRSVCSCKLLARTHLILFLNKCDLLQGKLQRGVRVRDSVPSFGDRKNDFATAVKCWFYTPFFFFFSSPTAGLKTHLLTTSLSRSQISSNISKKSLKNTLPSHDHSTSTSHP